LNYEDRDEISKVILSEDELIKKKRLLAKERKERTKTRKK